MWSLLAVLLKRTFRIRWDEDDLTLANLEEKRYDINYNCQLGYNIRVSVGCKEEAFSFHS